MNARACASELDKLVAEVKLVRLARRKVLRDKRPGHRQPAAFEGAHLPAHRVDRSSVSLRAQRLVDPLRRALLPGRQLSVGLGPKLQRPEKRT